MKTQIMLDLETLGNKPGSVIVSIGAVKFSEGKLLSYFYERIDAESCVKAGLQMNVSTIMWWLQQSEEARAEIVKPGKSLLEVLSLFSQWVGEDEVIVWGNGATFDNTLLSVAYDKVSMMRPWGYSNDRCYRTLKNLYPEIKLVQEGVLHDALCDAISQTKHLMEIMDVRKGTGNIEHLLK